MATTWTVQPRSWASLTSVPISEAGPAPQTMTVRTRLPGSLGAPIRLANCSASRWTLSGAVVTRSRTRVVHGGAAGDLLGGGLFGRAEREVGLFVPAALEERAGGVDEQRGLPLGDGDRA